MVKNKRAAIELSMSTIVIVVLAMSMLILGLVLVQKIFNVAEGAVTDVDKGVRNSIMNMFSDSDSKIIIYPSTRTIEIEQKTQGQGFVFSVRNSGVSTEGFDYSIEVEDNFEIQDQCKISKAQADDWLVIPSGSFTLGPGEIMENPKLVLFNIPENAPPCTIPYVVDVTYSGSTEHTKGEYYTSDTLYLTVVPR